MTGSSSLDSESSSSLPVNEEFLLIMWQGITVLLTQRCASLVYDSIRSPAQELSSSFYVRRIYLGMFPSADSLLVCAQYMPLSGQTLPARRIPRRTCIFPDQCLAHGDVLLGQCNGH